MTFQKAQKLKNLSSLIGIEKDKGIKGYINHIFLTIEPIKEQELTEKFLDYTIDLLLYLKCKKNYYKWKKGIEGEFQGFQSISQL